MGASHSTRMMKLLALVAALVVAAKASPVAQNDVTDFDKVSAMITDAQNDNFEKAGYEAEMMPAWETPEWMGRRTNSSVRVAASVSLTGTYSAAAQAESNTEGSTTYAYFACTFLTGVGLACPTGVQSPTTVDGISFYSQTASFTSRRATATLSTTMDTTKFASAAAFSTQVASVDSAAWAAAASTATSTLAAASVTVAGVTVSGGTATATTPPASSASRTTFGIAALIAALFAQLF